MTWTFVLIIIAGIIVKFLTSPPSALVGWFLDKFELHPKIDAADSTVLFDGEYLDEDEKSRFIDSFNKAQFLNKNHIFPGKEELFLHPETNSTPYIVHFKKKKKEMTFHVFSYDNHVDVVKQWKKKMASYTLNSEYLQQAVLTGSKPHNV
ncbi:YfmQ family protein [Oceanobacillus sojae]|uniref:YfmQ family protein n=1 Tax=Oceanobacillus sojae TaxID=582851 RepID=UPI0021A8897D|nr:YfmQ family protein [Oceanobacillus sojae]MCT1904869.1 YfmQ family protein [Oceanobacillus sojae]